MILEGFFSTCDNSMALWMKKVGKMSKKRPFASENEHLLALERKFGEKFADPGSCR